MKKFVVGLMVLMLGLALVSCAGAPPAQDPPPPPPPAPAPAAPPPPPPPPPPAPVVVGLDLTGAQQYTVVEGDTLSEIARRFYGAQTNVGEAGTRNGFFFPIIQMASGIVIDDPDVLFPGMILTVPDLRRNLDAPGSRQAVINGLREAANFFEGRRPLDVEGLRRLADSL